MTTQLTWIKSSHSGSEGNCVEVAVTAGQVLIRDSKNSGGPVLAIPATAWRRFARVLTPQGRLRPDPVSCRGPGGLQAPRRGVSAL